MDEALRYARAVAAHSTDNLMLGRKSMTMFFRLLGVDTYFNYAEVAHPLFTNMVWREDEHNFLRERNKYGNKEGMRRLNAVGEDPRLQVGRPTRSLKQKEGPHSRGPSSLGIVIAGDRRFAASKASNPVKAGARFSLKAVVASLWSSVPMASCSEIRPEVHDAVEAVPTGAC